MSLPLKLYLLVIAQKLTVINVNKHNGKNSQNIKSSDF